VNDKKAEKMKIALIYPPTADPTAPYLSVPALTGFLRANGVDVLPIDANIEAYDHLLTQQALTSTADRLKHRLKRLNRKSVLKHEENIAWFELTGSRRRAGAIPVKVEDAVSVMRDQSGARFYDPEQYETAASVIEEALHLISAAYTPLTLDFSKYRTPFSLLNRKEIRADAEPDRNPFHEYYCRLVDRLSSEQPDMAGISIVFSGQIQPAYSLAYMLRKNFPGLYLTAGGPAITQVFSRLSDNQLKNAIAPFDSSVLFEGETALLNVISDLKKGRRPQGRIPGERCTDLGTLPPPDFDGLPMDKYLSPEPVLPYDATRGCYWGKCAFCHYGLAETGTAPYRQRPVKNVVSQLHEISSRNSCNLFYLSQDTMSPKYALQMARAVEEATVPWKWASDMRPEAALSPETCRRLHDGGALAFSLGIESGSRRILSLINKGVSLEDMRSAIQNLSGAGIAAECMTFTGFPGETGQEALATIHFIESLRNCISLFICGQFDLVPGSRIARYPRHYGISDIWTVSGDEFIKTLFYEEQIQPISSRDADKVESAIENLSRKYWLHAYPWAGSLSTAHTLLWYQRFGPGIFRHSPEKSFKRNQLDYETDWPTGRRYTRALRSERIEADIWETLIYEKRSVSRDDYHRLAKKIPR
jgi:radical SAM superfamily enzyme YgiQ (UPF0313 family)